MPPFMGLTTWAAFKSGKYAETMVAGDVIAARETTQIRGGSEGTISILALPDLETKVGELPIAVESEETSREGESSWQTSV